MTIRITVNGEEREVADGLSVAVLVGELGLHPEAVAVERNGDVLPRRLVAETTLRTGDRIEVVRFVQGG